MWLLVALLVLFWLAACDLQSGEDAFHQPAAAQPSAVATMQPLFTEVPVASGSTCCPGTWTLCRMCMQGKACGNACIQATDVCHIAMPGCACDVP